MTGTRPADILRQLEPPAETDAALLARFARARDAAAFAELVRRHGPLVLGVCRRVTGNSHDAEDAFQASFLVLAQKAGALSNAALLGNWLYGVAFRVALRAKRAATRRRAREVTVPIMPDPPAPESRAAVPEFGPVLDEELAALAEHYRDAIVLCDLRGLSREAAAEALGVPEGTLSSRLANGRKQLAARLARRGIALPATGLAMALGTATASVPAELLARTCETVTDWAATGTAPAALAALTKGGLTMRLSLLFGSVLALGITGAVFAALPANEPPPKQPAVANAGDDKKPEPKAVAAKPAPLTNAPRLINSFDDGIKSVSTVRWNSTGTHFVINGVHTVRGRGPGVGPGGVTEVVRNGFRLYSAEKDRHGFSLTPGEFEELVGIAPDGSGIFTARREFDLISGEHRLTFNKKPAGETPGVLEPGRSVRLESLRSHTYAFNTKGDAYRTFVYNGEPGRLTSASTVYEVNVATGETSKPLLKLGAGTVSLSPTGTRAALVAEDQSTVTVYDVTRGTKVCEHKIVAPADVPPSKGEYSYAVFSADGKRLCLALNIGLTVILDADTGKPLPALEGTGLARVTPDFHAFTGDGRAFASIIVPYKLSVRKGGFGNEQKSIAADTPLLAVWDTNTGKLLKSWPVSKAPVVAMNPSWPMLLILEPNGEKGTRIGFWNFEADAGDEK